MQIQVNKTAAAALAAPSEADMQAINRFALRELKPEEVFTFRCVACDDRVDRDFERFPLETLEKLAPMFVGKTFILDHRWTAENQMARVYRTEVQRREDRSHAILAGCYMLRTDATADSIAAIEGGILKEVSVGCAVSRMVCSVCGEDAYARACAHIKGHTYDGETCVYDLLDPLDAYELSFVAVPAQRGAGVTKKLQKTCWTPAELAAAKARLEIEHERWK